jgi:hypothetical protein
MYFPKPEPFVGPVEHVPVKRVVWTTWTSIPAEIISFLCTLVLVFTVNNPRKAHVLTVNNPSKAHVYREQAEAEERLKRSDDRLKVEASSKALEALEKADRPGARSDSRGAVTPKAFAKGVQAAGDVPQNVVRAIKSEIFSIKTLLIRDVEHVDEGPLQGSVVLRGNFKVPPVDAAKLLKEGLRERCEAMGVLWVVPGVFPGCSGCLLHTSLRLARVLLHCATVAPAIIRTPL